MRQVQPLADRNHRFDFDTRWQQLRSTLSLRERDAVLDACFKLQTFGPFGQSGIERFSESMKRKLVEVETHAHDVVGSKLVIGFTDDGTTIWLIALWKAGEVSANRQRRRLRHVARQTYGFVNPVIAKI